MRFKLGALLAVMVLASTAHAKSHLALDLSKDAARLQYTSTASMSAESELEWDAGFLLLEGKNGNDDRKLFSGTIRSIGDAGIANHQVSAALGIRGFWLNGDGIDAQAIAVGTELSARFKGIDRLAFSGYGYYSPSVLSFGDADEFFEWGARAGYQVLRNGEVFVGYRQVKFEPTQSKLTTIDSGYHVGIQFGF